MARLGDLRVQAAQRFANGDVLDALRTYAAIVAAAPLHVDARLRVADCLASLGRMDLATEVYRQVGWYALRAGHPLVAVVAARVLEASEQEADDLLAALVVRYGSESELLGKLAARIALPDDDLDIAPPDLASAAPADCLDRAAHIAAHCVDDFDQYPDFVHPVALLSSLSEDAFRRVLKTIVVRRLPAQSMVIREGEPGQSFYFVAGGRLRVFDIDGLGRERDLATLGSGAIFGEMALLSAQPRTASVQALTECDLLELTRASLAALADELSQVADALHGFTRERLLKNLMATSPLFRPFDRLQRVDLLRRFTSHDVAPGTPIINQGEQGRGLFVVLSGQMDVARIDDSGASLPLATLAPGAVFGELAILRGGPTTATVSASRPSTVLFLASEYVHRLVAGVPEIKSYLDALAEERELDTQLLLSDEDLVEEDERVLI